MKQITEDARLRGRQDGRPEGLIFKDANKRIEIWVKPWSQIIEECRARLSFYQTKLRYAADLDSAKEYLQKAHAKYLPEIFSKAEKRN